jgi:hypothetical protein
MPGRQQPLQPSSLAGSDRIPLWQQLYLNVHREKDIKRITLAVIAAEGAICTRFQELSELSGRTEEWSQLKAASEELLAIKIQKLGWPPPSS